MNVIFISSADKLTFCVHKKMETWDDFKGFVFISDSILKEPEEAQILAIAHEIAHIKLGHKSRFLELKEEEEANAFLKIFKKWIWIMDS